MTLKRTKRFVLKSILLILIAQPFSIPAHAADPLTFEGWNRCNDQPDPAHYDFSISTKTDTTTGALVSAVNLYSKDDNENLASHLGFFKSYDATPYAGQTIRFSIQVLADRLTEKSSVKNFLGVTRKFRQGEGETTKNCWFFFDNMDDRPFTTIGKEGVIEIIAKIPSTAERFSMGPMLEGNGNILLYNPMIEIIDPATKETGLYTKENSPDLVPWCQAN